MRQNHSTGWRRYSVWLFVVLAYAITWSLWIPVELYAVRQGYLLPNPATLLELTETGLQDRTHLWLSTVSMLIDGPFLAAIILLAFESGRKGLRNLWQSMVHWRLNGRWYLIATLLIGLIYTPAAVAGMVRGPMPTVSQALGPLVWIVPWFLFTLMASGTEEPGWRGYALPRLQAHHGPLKASLILGVIWGVWHWPVFIPFYTQAASDPGTSVPAALLMTLTQLVTYTFGALVGEAIIYTWLYNRTRSVFLCILFHVLHNMAGTYVGMVLPAAVPNIPVLAGVAQWVIAITLMRRYGIDRQVATIPMPASSTPPAEKGTISVPPELGT